MGKIVAIGGGEIGRPNKETGGFYPIETLSIDKEVVRLTGKEHPKLLLLPTASYDDAGYYRVIKKYYGERLGCETDVLYLTKRHYSGEELRRKILGSDIIYVGGGNTKMMLEVWKQNGVDKILREAYDKGIVLAGISAGAICWFKYGNSDSPRFNKEGDKTLIKLKGLDLIDSMACPHYNGELHRPSSLREMIRKHGGRAIAFDNCTALEIVDGTFRILSSTEGAHAYKLYRTGNRVVEKSILIGKTFKSLDALFGKENY